MKSGCPSSSPLGFVLSVLSPMAWKGPQGWDFLLCRALGRFGCTVLITSVAVHFGSNQKWDSGVSVLLECLLCLLWMASQHIVGVHVAMFTADEVLSAAAFLEFRHQVDALLAQGDWAGALRLWSSVVLFEHMPPSTPRVFVPVVTRGEGAMSSRIGIWNRRGTVVPSGLTPQQAWDRRARLEASMDLLLLQPHGAPYSAADFVPSYLWEFVQKVPGDLDLQTFQSEVLYYMRRWLLGSPHGLWINPFRAPTPFARRSVHIEPFVVSWDPQSTGKRNFLQHVVAVVILHIGSALYQRSVRRLFSRAPDLPGLPRTFFV